MQLRVVGCWEDGRGRSPGIIWVRPGENSTDFQRAVAPGKGPRPLNPRGLRLYQETRFRNNRQCPPPIAVGSWGSQSEGTSDLSSTPRSELMPLSILVL